MSLNLIVKTQELQLKACRDVVESNECVCSQYSSSREVETTTDVPFGRRYRDPIWKMALSG